MRGFLGDVAAFYRANPAVAAIVAVVGFAAVAGLLVAGGGSILGLAALMAVLGLLLGAGIAWWRATAEDGDEPEPPAAHR